jgi:ATP-dependent RNA helicase RhlE
LQQSNVSFASLALAAPVQQALSEEGYAHPTPIQALGIPPVLAGRDVLGCAQTGTGKTAAFAVPILSRLLAEPADKQRREHVRPRVLVLSPTRELASQIGDSFATYGRHTGLVHTVIFGGVSQFHQVRALHRGVDILVATPGRLIDLMQQRLVNLSEVRTFVLDEADRMLDMGFIKPIRVIAGALPSQRQTLLFSATMPREIMHLADALLKDPVKVTAAPPPQAKSLIEQRLYHVSQRHKPALLKHLLDDAEVTRAVVFIRTKHGANKLCTVLHRAGVEAAAIHGNKSQGQRERALDSFRDGSARVLVATDVAARGLDVDGVSHVFNFDLPMEPEAYVHRIGRTGRAGATGIAIAFCDEQERDLLRQIERLTGKHLPTREAPAEVLASVPANSPQHFEQPQHGDRSRGRGPRQGYGPKQGPREGHREVQREGGHPARPAPHKGGTRDGQGGHAGHVGHAGGGTPRPQRAGWHAGDDHAPHAPSAPHAPRTPHPPKAPKASHAPKSGHPPKPGHSPKVGHPSKPGHGPRPAHGPKSGHAPKDDGFRSARGPRKMRPR